MCPLDRLLEKEWIKVMCRHVLPSHNDSAVTALIRGVIPEE